MIRAAKRNKSVGLDNLPYEIFKGNSSFAILTLLFNKMYTTNITPTVWGMSLIKPLPKNSMTDPHLPLQYRGISLLSTVYKLFTAVLNSRIQNVSETHNLLADEQNGFRSNRSCEDHIFSLTSIIRNRKKEKLDTFVTFVDFEKAFDRVDRKLLFYKLKSLGFGNKITSILKTLYRDNRACLNINGYISPSFQSNSGVKQGDSLSPTLFNLYINDLIHELNGQHSGVSIDEQTQVSALMYADDLAIISDNEQNMQVLIDTLENWCSKWRMTVNTNKTKVVHFRSPSKPRSNIPLKMNNYDIDYVNQYKYLGIILDEYLLFNVTASTLAKAGNRALAAIYTKFNKLKGLGYKTFSKLYHTGVAPILDYCSGIWGFQNFGYIDTIQNKAIRFFLGVHRFSPNLAINGDVAWCSSTIRRRVEMLRFWNRVVGMDDNRLTKRIFLWDYSKRSCKGNWNSDIYKLFTKIGRTDHFTNLSQVNVYAAKTILEQEEENEWQNLTLSSPKLRTFKLFKNEYKTEPYVIKIHNRAHRSVFAQLRCGILPLKIETGRYTNIPKEFRLCIFCEKNEIEDEIHFLFECPFYNDVRLKFWPNFNSSCSNFGQLENVDKLGKMMSNELVKISSLYVYECFLKRRNCLYQNSM